jgi:hypothetical protein
LLRLQAVCAHVCQEPGQSSKVLKARAAALCSLGVIFQVGLMAQLYFKQASADKAPKAQPAAAAVHPWASSSRWDFKGVNSQHG